MDPFTITTSVLRITTTCIDAAKTLHDIRSAWARAPVTVSSLCSQLKLTSASLSQIQVLILGENDILKDKPDLIETFDTTLTSCLVLSTWLDGIMQRITKGVLGGTKATWRTKFKTMWNEAEIKELVEQLHTQQGAIGVLIGLLQIDSISEIKNLVRRHEALLQEIALNTRRSRTRHSIEARSSILLTDEQSNSLLSKLAEDPVLEKPNNDDSLKAIKKQKGTPSPQPWLLNDQKPEASAQENSLKPRPQHKRTPSPHPPPLIKLPAILDSQTIPPKTKSPSLHPALRSRSPSPSSAPAPFQSPQTIINQASNLNLTTNFSNSQNYPHTLTRTPSRSYDESHSDALRPDLPIYNFVIVEQSFLAAKEHLQVGGVHASSWRNVPSRRQGELNLIEDHELAKIRKANDYWYFCELVLRHGTGQLVEGLVERSNMIVRFTFKETLLVHAVRTRVKDKGNKDELVYNVGDILELNGIHVNPLQLARRRPLTRPTTTNNPPTPFSHINVLDIGLSGVSRKYIDSLLDFVACPHPDLVDATGDELARRMKVLVLGAPGEKRKMMWGRMFAHCRSWGDLQVVAKVVDEMEGQAGGGEGGFL